LNNILFDPPTAVLTITAEWGRIAATESKSTDTSAADQILNTQIRFKNSGVGRSWPIAEQIDSRNFAELSSALRSIAELDLSGQSISAFYPKQKKRRCYHHWPELEVKHYHGHGKTTREQNMYRLIYKSRANQRIDWDWLLTPISCKYWRGALTKLMTYSCALCVTLGTTPSV
jgi:hypothetical protein